MPKYTCVSYYFNRSYRCRPRSYFELPPFKQIPAKPTHENPQGEDSAKNGLLFSERGAWCSSSSLSADFSDFSSSLFGRRRDSEAISSESFQPRSAVSTYFGACACLRACLCTYTRGRWQSVRRGNVENAREPRGERKARPSVRQTYDRSSAEGARRGENVVGFREAWSFAFRAP